MLTRHMRNFRDNHGGTDVCMGLLTGYACCTSNMHQGWPKFTQNLWYATADGGIAALIYSPSTVKATVGNGTEVMIDEKTTYPFGETIQFALTMAKGTKPVAFPFHLRVPGWCREATVLVNGQSVKTAKGGQIVVTQRTWQSGDVVELRLPMQVYRNEWYEKSVSVERGPLAYALKMGEEEKQVRNTKDPIEFGADYTEVRPTTPWNYALLDGNKQRIEQTAQVSQKDVPAYPWNAANAPLEIRLKAKRIPTWTLYNDSAGPLPYSTIYGIEAAKETEEVVLIPYGCTTLRIAQFPVIR